MNAPMIMNGPIVSPPLKLVSPPFTELKGVVIPLNHVRRNWGHTAQDLLSSLIKLLKEKSCMSRIRG